MSRFALKPSHRTGTALSALGLALALSLSACSKKEDAPSAAAQPSAKTDKPAAPAAVTPASAYDTVAAQGKGFTAGMLMSSNSVYVLFDPQCPHCSHLWQASLPLHKKIKFVWIPVSIINAKSGPQGATLLAAANPVELMTAHETSILAGTGGIPAASNLTPEVEAAIKTNTQLFNTLGGESVPFIITKHARTGQAQIKAGSLDTAALTAFLGLDQP